LAFKIQEEKTENKTKTRTLFGRKTCGECEAKEKRLRQKKLNYKYISADSAVGQAWLNKHGVEDLPALRVCSTGKDGKTKCYVYQGRTRKREK
jgi:hypothetical protein